MTSNTTQEETQVSTTSTITSPIIEQKLRDIAPAPNPEEKSDYDVYHIPKGFEVYLVSKNNDSETSNADSSPIPLSPTGSVSSSSSSTLCDSPKIIAPKLNSEDDENDNKATAQSSWRKRKNNGHIPRPKNCFMAYREHMQHKVLAENPGMNNKLVSVIAAQMWNKEPEETKQLWRERAQQLKIEHMNKYPDYKFTPKKKVPKNLGVKSAKTISKKSSNNSKLINEEFARGLLLRRDNFGQSNYYPSHHNENPLWVGHCRSNSVESASSWSSNDSTICDRSSPLRYETNDWKMYEEYNEFSSLNSSPHLTAVPNTVYDTILMPGYDNSMQIGDSPESTYYDTHEEYEEFIQPDATHLLDSFVLQHPAPMHQIY